MHHDNDPVPPMSSHRRQQQTFKSQTQPATSQPTCDPPQSRNRRQTTFYIDDELDNRLWTYLYNKRRCRQLLSRNKVILNALSRFLTAEGH
jgi:hypothetical protein